MQNNSPTESQEEILAKFVMFSYAAHLLIKETE